MSVHAIFLPKMLGLVLAGGPGSRLGPLTKYRCKPAMPFGKHTLIQFTLGNIVNSSIIDHTYVLTQYMQQGVLDILGRMDFESPIWDKFIRPLPAQQQLGTDWYLGSANALYQNYHRIRADPSEWVLITAADHIYFMDYRQLLVTAIETGADVVVSGQLTPVHVAAGSFGVMSVDASDTIVSFVEKPLVPEEYPGMPGQCISSQGIYVFRKDFLLRALQADYENVLSTHDMGRDIIPWSIREGVVKFFNSSNNHIPGMGKVNYWRDVGTIGSYWQANMDQTHYTPELNLYDTEWSIPTYWDKGPMMKGNGLCCGCGDDKRFQFIAAGGHVTTRANALRHVVLGRRTVVEEGASLHETILFDDSSVGRGAMLVKTIVEEGIIIPDGCVVGVDLDDDLARNIHVDEESGIRIVYAESHL